MASTITYRWQRVAGQRERSSTSEVRAAKRRASRRHPSASSFQGKSHHTSVICSPGYSKSVRHTSGHLKAFIYREYGIDRRNGHYEIDHLIPLGLGGAEVAATRNRATPA